ncbi:MAG TPA: AMP-binding protein, partial [Pyrinomonadaceae bacterium]|nr:AMP-binding protein [Pyrinomonadaceae bacterium]
MIFSSPHEAVTIPETSLTEYVLGRAHEFGNKPALIDGLSGRTISYDELVDKTKRLATGLARHGFQRGDVLAIFSPNSPEYVLAFLAVAMLGGATTMVPPLFTAEEVRTQLTDSEADYLLTIPQLLPKLKQVMPASTVREVFVVGEAEGAIPLSALLDQKTQPPPELNLDPRSDVVALPYSSGTTGFPKGVMLTHYNMVSTLRQLHAVEALNEEDTLVCVVPMYHLYGLHVVVNLGLSQGATIVTLPRYDLGQFLKTLERYRVTVAPLVPPLVLELSRAPELDHHDLSQLRLIHCG